MAEKFTQIGFITGAHGIRGQVKIRSFTDTPEDIFSYPVLWDSFGKRTFTLTRQGAQEPNFIASVEGINDRNAAELLKGTGLFIPKSEVPEQESMIGLEARLDNGNVYGSVIGVYNFGAGDILEIELANKTIEMLPSNDAFMQRKDGFIVVFPPDYVEAKE